VRYALITKIFHFEAAHHLPGHRGKCARPHGHSYRLEISLRGPIKHAPGQTDNGMVMDFGDLSLIVKEAVIARLDHYDLNDVTRLHTTAENMTHWIWDTLVAAGLPDDLIHRIRLWETASAYAEITREEREQP
jgi:6-pyruvoyltetrahydropterin/6-carboxytetrahydropterin synthase